MRQLEHIRGSTFHGRRGEISNSFSYGVDYVLFDAENPPAAPRFFSFDQGNIWSVANQDHGGMPKQGVGVSWVRDVLAMRECPEPARIDLLTQPRFLGHVFNPVSFWLCYDAQDQLWAVIAEVTNTFGDRHSYLCHHAEFTPIYPRDRLRATKIFHVSPFQPIEGEYQFNFDISSRRINIRIELCHGNGGVIATLTGDRRHASLGSLVKSAFRRPLGSWRVQALIHWQALRLWVKGAKFWKRPPAPKNDVS